MTMYFQYNPQKTAQAAAYLVSLSGGRMDLFSLIKILYLSDRMSLSRRGLSITGDEMVSMPHGPVLSRTYDNTKCGIDLAEAKYWYEYLSERDNNTISLRQPNPRFDELSEFERDVLSETFARFSRLSFHELKKITHDLPEYRDPNGSMLPIDPTVILRDAGWSEEDIQEVIRSSQEEKLVRDFCA